MSRSTSARLATFSASVRSGKSSVMVASFTVISATAHAFVAWKQVHETIDVIMIARTTSAKIPQRICSAVSLQSSIRMTKVNPAVRRSSVTAMNHAKPLLCRVMAGRAKYQMQNITMATIATGSRMTAAFFRIVFFKIIPPSVNVQVFAPSTVL